MPPRWDRTYQLGVVVRDLDEAERHFIRAGVGKFDTGLSASVRSRRIYGRTTRDVAVRSSVALMGPLELELLQPVSGEGLQAELLAERGEGAIHLCAFTDDLDQEVRDMSAAGFDAVSTGELEDGGRFAFFETRAMGGLLLGLFEPGPSS
jgi:Glyoxalase/Bleomycin resistance protein/Dioxygenase superfamily